MQVWLLQRMLTIRWFWISEFYYGKLKALQTMQELSK
jgi:hypothetical protein